MKQPKPPRRSAAVAVDISKAFDRVDLPLLLDEIRRTTLHPNIIRWLRSYLCGRQAACIFQGTRSAFRKLHWGVPQGSVISPVLFNYFVRDFPTCEGIDVTTSYADDFTLVASLVDPDLIDEKLNHALRKIAKWAKRKHLSISAEKSSVTFFTTDTHQHHHHPQVFYRGSLLPLVKNPRILGVTLDPHYTFGPHVKTVVNKLAARLKVLKALAGTNWGNAKEDLLLTFKSLGGSVIDYAAPIFSPSLKQTHVKKLQMMQNHCLRVITWRLQQNISIMRP